MKNLDCTRAGPKELTGRWRQQVARQHRRRVVQGPRPLAGIGYLVHGPVIDGLIDLRQLVFVTLFDEHPAAGRTTTRFAGFASSAIPWGIKIGGPEQCRFEKDLARAPGFGVKGRRFDLSHPDLLKLALDLDRYVERHLRFPHMPRLRQPRWPALWATIDAPAMSNISGEGPEFEAFVRQTGNGHVDLLRASTRSIRGRTAFPLSFVSHTWRQFSTVYADLKSLPKRQVVTLDHDPANNLCGFSGAIEFDLFHTRFAAAAKRSGHRSRRIASLSC